MAGIAQTQRHPGKAEADKNRKETKQTPSKSGNRMNRMKHNIHNRGSNINPKADKKPTPPRKTKSAKKEQEQQSAVEKERVVKAYDWPDEKGNLLAQHLRYEPKRFGWRRPIRTISPT